MSGPIAGERTRASTPSWLAEHFGAAEHAGWLRAAVAASLALPPRPRGERLRNRACRRTLPGPAAAARLRATGELDQLDDRIRPATVGADSA